MKKASTAVLALLIMVALLSSPARAGIAPDKKLHFQAGLIISSLFYGLHTYGPNSDGDGLTKEQYRLLRRKEALTWALLTTVSAGIGKELLDGFGMGTPEWEDLMYTTYGGLVGSLLCLALDHLLSKTFDLILDIPNREIGLQYKLNF